MADYADPDDPKSYKLLQVVNSREITKVFKAKLDGVRNAKDLAIKVFDLSDFNGFFKAPPDLPQNPHIVPHYHVPISEKKDWVIMPYYNLGSMRDILDVLGRGLTEIEVKSIIRRVLLGLDCAHKSGFVFEDIKPSNILLHNDGNDSLINLSHSFLYPNYTSLMVKDGRPRYWLPPELMNLSELFTNSDIWSIGVLALELFYGGPPIYRTSPMLGAFDRFKHTDTDTVVEEYEKDLSNDFKDFLNLCFAFEPSERFPAAALLGHPIMRPENVLDVRNLTTRMDVAMKTDQNNTRKKAPELNDCEKTHLIKVVAKFHTCYNLCKYVYLLHPHICI